MALRVVKMTWGVIISIWVWERGLALQLGRWHTLWQRPQLLTFAVITEAALISKAASRAAFEKACDACVCVHVCELWAGVCKFIIKFVAWKLSCLFNGVVKCVFIMASLTALLGIHKSLWRRVSLQNLARAQNTSTAHAA